MFLSSKQELATLFGAVVSGGGIGMTVDLFRILRRSFKSASGFVWLQDTLMWCVILAEVCAALYVVSSGEVRWYVLLGFGVGFLLYILTLSRYIVAFATAVVCRIITWLRFVLTLFVVPVKGVGAFALGLWRKAAEFSKKFHIRFKKN